MIPPCSVLLLPSEIEANRPRMDVKLMVQKGSTRTRVIHLRNEESIVGRRQDCDVRIESSQVSRRHCLLRMQGQYLAVEDLDSVNGTYVNGKRITGKQVLRPGDKLEIGPICFLVQYAAPRGEGSGRQAAPPPPAPSEEELDVLPLAEDDTEAAPLESLEALELAPVEDDAPAADGDSAIEALEVAEALENDEDWHLPVDNELRDILSDMDLDVDGDSKRK